MLAAWLNGTPVRIYHMRGLPLLAATGLRRRLLWMSEYVACLAAHRVLCVSDSLRLAAIARGLCPPRKIAVLAAGSGNGVDALRRFNPEHVGRGPGQALRARLGIAPDAPVVGFVGRVVRAKGVEELAAAWPVVRRMRPDACLLLAGPVESEDPVRPEVLAWLRAEEGVFLLGRLDDPVPVYAASDLVVLPSHREGFPNVLLEAGAMGLPVVATRVPGCVDAVVGGITGTLVPPGDVPALADALLAYLADGDLRRRHGEAARARVRAAFTPERIWEALLAEYDCLLAARHLARRIPPR